jgi:methyltransferase (TIGR00027 family)
MLCRKRYIDEKLQGADSQIDAAVILGAGFDTRAYRLPVLAETPVYELDLPTNIERKRTRLTKLFHEVPANVTLVPIDFETQDLADSLADHGYRPERPTFFVWEAVTQYLTEPGVRKTFDFLATAAVGSHLVLTYVRKDFLDGTALYGGENAYQEFVVKRQLWHFGMDPDHVAKFLADYGWSETEQMGPQEFTEPIPQAQWPRVASVGDRTFRLRQKDLTQTAKGDHATNRSSTIKPTPPQPAPPFTMSSRPYTSQPLASR